MIRWGLKFSLLWMLVSLFSAPLMAGASMDAVEARVAAGDDNGAVALLKDILAADNNDYQAWFMLGVTQARQRRFKDAEVAFQNVVRLKPNLAEPHNNLAVIYNEQGELTAAIRELEASLKLNPDYITAYENIGDLYLKLAARSYRNALAKGENPGLRMRYDRLLHLRDDEAAEPAPAKNPAPVAASAESDSSLVFNALEAWRSAWSHKDLAGYFSAYADDFDPGKRFDSIAAWQRYKKRVIMRRYAIHVALDDLVMRPMQDGTYLVEFKQDYRADDYRSHDSKTLILKNTPAGWKITREISR